MIRHYITLAFRTLWRNKFHTFINITGLAIGISACLVIYLIVSFELSFNKKLPDYDRLYRVHSKFSGTFAGLNRGAPLAAAGFIKDNFKGVESVSMFYIFGSKVQVPGVAEVKKLDHQDAVIIAGPEYFTVFNGYTWITGSPDILKKPNQVVLTEKQAKIYFGDVPMESITGKEVIYRDSLTVHVGGVVANLPYRTDLAFTEFISSATIESSWLKKSYNLDDWESTNSSTQIFIKSMPETTHADLLAQLPELTKKYAEKSSWTTNNFNVQPMSDLHYNSETGIFDFNDNAAHMPTLLTLLGVAVLLLLIGSINFINLETAQAVRRAKEVGVRKVLGSTRSRLVIQFLCEGMLLTVVAVMLALPLTELGLSVFEEFVPKGVSLNIADLVPFLLFVIFFIGILASAYPAFILSSFLPALVLKNQSQVTGSQSRSAYLRKVLIVFQFSSAQVLIIGTLMVGWQIRYMLNKDLGFRKDAVIYFNTPWWEKPEKAAQFRHELEGIPEINGLTFSEAPPAYNGWSSSSVEYNNGHEKENINAYRKFGDTAYLDFYGIQLLAGRNIAQSDTAKEFVINETMMKKMGFDDPREVIGQAITYHKTDMPIVGVVKDFHIQSLHNKVEAVMIANESKTFSCVNLRLETANQSGDNLKASLGKIEAAWKKIYPDAPFEHQFLDETVKNFYQTEQRTAKLSRTATGLAIFVSCLGLFGLASFTTTQRIKEIGIRKVFGASISEIVALLSRDFIILVLIGFAIAAPAAWFSINIWLEGFQYKATPGAWMFVLTAVLAVLLAFVTVSYQTIRAAKRSPAESLRNE